MNDTDLALHAGKAEALFPPPAIDEVERVGGPRASVSAATSGLVWLLQRVFSFPAMLGSALVGAAFYAGRSFAVDPDLWWHSQNGQNILATHHWPTTDPFSFTVAGTPWLAYEWLGDVAIGATAKLGGLVGLDILLIVLGSAIMLSLYAFATLRSGNSKAGFAAAAMLFTFASPTFSMRPQMFGYLFIILTLIVLERYRQGKSRTLWLLPPLFLIWINTHGSWVIGLGIIFVVLAAGLTEFRAGAIESKRWSYKQRLQLELVFALSLAMIPLTPYGTRLAAYPFMVASSLPLNVSNVMEWFPMPFNMLGGKLFLGLVLGYFVLHMVLRFTVRLHEFALFFGGTVMAFLHVRFVMLFVPFFAPLLAVLLARYLPTYVRHKDKYVLNAILMAVAVVAMVHYMPTNADLREIVAKQFPVRAVEYIRGHDVPGPMFNTYGYGGYLIGALPEQKVFIDGRGDLYEAAGAFGDYLQVAGLQPAAFSVLRSYGIRSCLLERKEPLATVLGTLPDWKQEYSDATSVLFVRRDPVTLAVARKD